MLDHKRWIVDDRSSRHRDTIEQVAVLSAHTKSFIGTSDFLQHGLCIGNIVSCKEGYTSGRAAANILEIIVHHIVCLSTQIIGIAGATGATDTDGVLLLEDFM